MYLDLYKTISSEGEFRHKISKLATEIHHLEKQVKSDPVHNTAIAERMADIYRLCQYNPTLLVPYFFPKYPYDKPLSMLSRPFSVAMLDFQFGGYTVIRASRQIGKCLTVNTLCNFRVTETTDNKTEKKMSLGEVFSLAESMVDA